MLPTSPENCCVQQKIKLHSGVLIPWPKYTKTSFFETRLALRGYVGLRSPVIQKTFQRKCVAPVVERVRSAVARVPLMIWRQSRSDGTSVITVPVAAVPFFASVMPLSPHAEHSACGPPTIFSTRSAVPLPSPPHQDIRTSCVFIF